MPADESPRTSAGVLFGVCTILMRKANRAAHEAGNGDHGAVRFLFAGNLLAALIGLPALITVLSAGGLGVAGGAALVWLGFGQLGGGYLAVQHGLRRVPALQASVLTLIEPILNPVWVALTVGEMPTAGTLAGGAFVLGGMLLGVLWRK
ncbi:DMT family transporter [Candidatus Poribacteria bacterium]|nr:DMT family transporter [Candidatus Poribacteria bacterium]